MTPTPALTLDQAIRESLSDGATVDTLVEAVRQRLVEGLPPAEMNEMVKEVKNRIIDSLPSTTTAQIREEVLSTKYEYIDPDYFILAGVDCHPTVRESGKFENDKPVFSVGEFAQFFFARSSYWVRWLDKKAVVSEVPCEQCGGTGKRTKGKCRACDGEKSTKTYWPGWRQAKRTPSGARYYTLDDVEAIAHLIAQHNIISPAELRLTLLLVKVQAQMYRLIL